MISALSFRLTKRFGSRTVLDEFTLEVHGGEFVTFLGPSGCGKSTALNLLAGLLPATSGEIRLDGSPIDHLPPETIARAGEGVLAALKTYDERRLSRVGRGSPDQRPSMGQDMAKGRRTEIEFLNGFVVREGEQVGIQARANERLVDIVKKVERGELQQDPRHITELRLN